MENFEQILTRRLLENNARFTKEMAYDTNFQMLLSGLRITDLDPEDDDDFAVLDLICFPMINVLRSYTDLKNSIA